MKMDEPKFRDWNGRKRAQKAQKQKREIGSSGLSFLHWWGE
jgi:hypothetical protein